MSTMKADWEKAIIFSYIAECGIPPAKAGENDCDVQARTLALLLDWTKERAVEAFEEATRRGMTEGPTSYQE